MDDRDPFEWLELRNDHRDLLHVARRRGELCPHVRPGIGVKTEIAAAHARTRRILDNEVLLLADRVDQIGLIEVADGELRSSAGVEERELECQGVAFGSFELLDFNAKAGLF